MTQEEPGMIGEEGHAVPEKPVRVTDREREALRWLTRNGRVEFHASALEGLYAERFRVEDDPHEWGTTQSRRGAWRRTSGAVMARMQRKGLLESRPSDGYTGRYSLTNAGCEALARSGGPGARQAGVAG